MKLETNICPKCEKENTDNWPLDIDGEIKEGGCQMCWEAECDKSWWEMVDGFGLIGINLHNG